MIIITKNKLSFKVNGEYKVHWRSLQSGRWEPYTFEIFDNFINKDDIYVDVGAWMGSTVLYACQLCKICYAIEPDFKSSDTLNANLMLNDFKNVVLCRKALSNKSEIIRLYNNNKFGDRTTSVICKNKECEHIDVKGITFEDFMSSYNINRVDFIKMDIEGFEEKVIPNMKNVLFKFKPTLYLSLHHCFIEDFSFLNSIIDIYKNIYKIDKTILKKNTCVETLNKYENEALVFSNKDWN